ncbi:MAG: phosphotriesterase family protein [Mariniphaga sp.]
MSSQNNRFVRTVLGDILPEEMGLTYSHEHIIIEESFPTLSNPLFILNDVEKVSRELTMLYEAGGRTVVDTMPANCGRNVEKLAEVSRRSKMHVIAPTGIHLEKYYVPNHWRYFYTEDQLSRLFIDDITLGIDRHDYGGPLVERTPHKAGLIKLATGDDRITPHQEKIFRAVVNAHIETGAPILTHTNAGQLSLEQATLFSKLGADLSHVVISHADRLDDVGYHRELLQTGIHVEYDAAFRWKQGEVNVTYKLLESLLPEFPDQIVVGMDMAKNSYWKSYGGKPGLNYLVTEFYEEMKKRGLNPYLKNIFYSTPARLYSIKGIKK